MKATTALFVAASCYQLTPTNKPEKREKNQILCCSANRHNIEIGDELKEHNTWTKQDDGKRKGEKGRKVGEEEDEDIRRPRQEGRKLTQRAIKN